MVHQKRRWSVFGMAVRAGRKVRKKPKHFFVNGELHRLFRVNSGEDLVYAWNYTQNKRVAYVWSDTQKRMSRAFSVPEVAQMLGRNSIVIRKYISDGEIQAIQKTYSLDGRKKPGRFFFSEDDVRMLHSYLCTKNLGRPRKDGRLVQYPLPSKAELEAMIRQDTVIYVKDKTGEFTPVWKQPDW